MASEYHVASQDIIKDAEHVSVMCRRTWEQYNIRNNVESYCICYQLEKRLECVCYGGMQYAYS